MAPLLVQNLLMKVYAQLALWLTFLFVKWCHANTFALTAREKFLYCIAMYICTTQSHTVKLNFNHPLPKLKFSCTVHSLKSVNFLLQMKQLTWTHKINANIPVTASKVYSPSVRTTPCANQILWSLNISSCYSLCTGQYTFISAVEQILYLITN